jgi:signal transduction histidine kinase
LYIASELARLHGGALSVESRPEKGSTFSLLLPRG